MGRSFERDRTKGYVEPRTRHSTRMAGRTRAIINSLNEASPPHVEPLPAVNAHLRYGRTIIERTGVAQQDFNAHVGAENE